MLLASSDPLGDLAFPGPDFWQEIMSEKYMQGQTLLPVVCRVLTVSVGIVGKLELIASTSSACTLDCYTLQHNCDFASERVQVHDANMWLRRMKVNVAQLTAEVVAMLSKRMKLVRPLVRERGAFRLDSGDWKECVDAMRRCLKLQVTEIQRSLSAHEERLAIGGATPDQMQWNRTFEEASKTAIKWGELSRILDGAGPAGAGATSRVFPYMWRPPGESDSVAVVLKQFLNVTSLEDWDSEASNHLKREVHLARTCSGLNHVVKLHGVAFEDNCNAPQKLCLVFERKHTTLAEYLGNHPWVGLEAEMAYLAILLQVAEALEVLHQLTPAIIHRDLKPSNVLLEPIESDGHGHAVFLCDFGSAKAVKMDDFSNSNIGAVGTDAFRAPELDSENRATAKCDVYSFGATALQCVLGQSTDRLKACIDHVMNSDSSSLRCTREVATLLTRCLHELPKKRPGFATIKLKLSEQIRSRRTNFMKIGRADIEVIRQSKGGPFVYRVLKATDVLCEGLKAGNPFNQDVTAVDHVSRESNVRKSRFISTTLDSTWALWYYAKKKATLHEQCLIVRIDLDKLPQSCLVHSLNSPATRERLRFKEPGFGSMPANFGTNAFEVLLEPAAMEPVPLDAIVEVYQMRDILLTENIRLFAKLDEGHQGGKKYLSFKDWNDKIGQFARFGSSLSPQKALDMCRLDTPPSPHKLVVQPIPYGDGTAQAPKLWIGNTASRSPQWLRSNHIGAVLQCRPLEIGCLPPLPDEIALKCIPLVDSVEGRCDLPKRVQPLEFFRASSVDLLEVVAWIKVQLKDEGLNVLIHSTGQNRALAVAMAFLMSDVGSVNAVERLMESSSVQNLELPLYPALRQLWEKRDRYITACNRDVLQASLDAMQPKPKPSKRPASALSSVGRPNAKQPKGALEVGVREPPAPVAGSSSGTATTASGSHSQAAVPPAMSLASNPLDVLNNRLTERPAADARAEADRLLGVTGPVPVGSPRWSCGVQLTAEALSTVYEEPSSLPLAHEPYYVTWKAANSTRCTLLCWTPPASTQQTVLLSKDGVWMLPAPRWSEKVESVQSLLLDGEVIWDAGLVIFYAYDLLICRARIQRSGGLTDLVVSNDPDHANATFHERFNGSLFRLVGDNDVSAGQVRIRRKVPMFKAKFARDQAFYDDPDRFGIRRSGLIFVPCRSRFMRGENTNILEWKGADAILRDAIAHLDRLQLLQEMPRTPRDTPSQRSTPQLTRSHQQRHSSTPHRSYDGN